MQDIRAKAKELMKGFCRVCPECDGRACAGEVPGMGGLTTGASFKNNVKDLAKVKINMRLLHDVKTPDISATIFEKNLSAPFMAAPISGVVFNICKTGNELDYITAIVNGCRDAGIVGCTGDGVPVELYGSSMQALHDAKGYGIPFIKPWDGGEFEEKLEKAFNEGVKEIGMDIDAAGLITLAKMGRPVSPKTPAFLKNVADKIHSKGIKFILKGVMTPADAVLAESAGVDAIIVSNHGGRVLDHTPGTATVLPSIRASVKHMKVWADGGVRTGVDVFKMLALGADAVLIGRPYCIAAVGGDAEGVKKYSQLVMAQLTSTMVLAGCSNINDISMNNITISN